MATASKEEIVTYGIQLTLTEYEAKLLKAVTGNIGGSLAPDSTQRRTIGDIYKALSAVLPTEYGFDLGDLHVRGTKFMR